jgi:hypothetical protein
MGALTAITLTDSSAVDHVFSPTGKVGPELTELEWDDTANHTPVAAQTLNLKFSRATLQRPTDRTNGFLAIPIPYTDADGNEQVDDTWRFQFQVISPRSMPVADRTVAWSVAKALIAHASVDDYVVERDPFYG